jgi:hypothetical protein
VTAPTTAQSRALAERLRRREAVLLVALVLAATVPVVQYLLDQQQSRYALTAAVWDDGTLRLDRYTHVLGVDRAERDGHTYSDKAPGQPMLGVPFYALYRAVGGEPATVPRQRGNLGLWWVSVWSAAVPAAVLAWLMRRKAAEASPRHATAAAAALAFGTMLWPFATQLFSHVLSGLLGFAAWVVLDADGRRRDGGAEEVAASPGRLAAAGALAGAAVLTEYTLGLLAVILLVVAVLRHRLRAGWLALGGIPPAILLGLYNNAVFGGPLRVSYNAAAYFGEHHAQGLVGVQVPDPGLLATVLVGGRGLLTQTPIVLAALAGCVLLWRAGGRSRRLAVVPAVVFAAFVALQGGWSNATGGASPGARYVVPALPFLAAGAAAAFARWPRVTTAATAVGVVAMGFATLTHPLVGRTELFGIDNWVARAVQGQWTVTILTPVIGRWGIVVVLLASAGLAAWLAVTVRRANRAEAEAEAAGAAVG